MFADDKIMMIKLSDVRKCIKEIQEWYYGNNMKVNKRKSAYMKILGSDNI